MNPYTSPSRDPSGDEKPAAKKRRPLHEVLAVVLMFGGALTVVSTGTSFLSYLGDQDNHSMLTQTFGFGVTSALLRWGAFHFNGGLK